MQPGFFSPPPPEVLWDTLGPPVREKVIIDEQTYFIERPDDSDRLLKHPAVHSAFVQDEYMPYWTDLWPAARMLAKVVRREPWAPGMTALEIGCGLGLPGVVALGCGLRVTFSDYDACALRFAAQNARINGFSDYSCLQLDWRHPPDDLQVDVILAADLVYEERNVAPIVSCVKKVLRPEGFCLLTDQDRIAPQILKQALEDEGLSFTTQIVRAGEPNGRRLKGTLYRISVGPW